MNIFHLEANSTEAAKRILGSVLLASDETISMGSTVVVKTNWSESVLLFALQRDGFEPEDVRVGLLRAT